MKVTDATEAAARLAVVSDKSNGALDDAVRKWFVAHFVKGMSIALLRSIHQSGAFPAFRRLLAAASDADRATVLAKLDKYRTDVDMRPVSDILAHIEGLASGRIQPAEKPKPAPKPKPDKPHKTAPQGKARAAGKAGRAPVSVISGSKY